ncbi:MAG TPA: hypothetical protein VMY42_09480 [Thermoguttaceae bacterium]|nr:hypothetical protein [Thermoguttaceae bacterium]
MGVVFAAPQAVADVARKVDGFHEQFGTFCQRQMEDHAAALAATAELETAMETFDGNRQPDEPPGPERRHRGRPGR